MSAGSAAGMKLRIARRFLAPVKLLKTAFCPQLTLRHHPLAHVPLAIPASVNTHAQLALGMQRAILARRMRRDVSKTTGSGSPSGHPERAHAAARTRAAPDMNTPVPHSLGKPARTRSTKVRCVPTTRTGRVIRIRASWPIATTSTRARSEATLGCPDGWRLDWCALGQHRARFQPPSCGGLRSTIAVRQWVARYGCWSCWRGG